ncbi:MAG TPA: aldolase/citrate lyase family protein [Phycisphaerae bacterium]|jgi:4-hydroxy-2-oxoheptanedioate aldolase
MKNLRERILGGHTALGAWLSLGSGLTAEIVGGAGFDWCLIDLEHGAGDEQQTLAQMQGLAATGAAAMVRVESHERQRVHRILDMGAEGIMFPRLATPEEAQQAISAMRYQPEGLRGVAKNVRASGFGVKFDDYFTHYKQRQIGIVQIENQEILGHLDAVAALDGVDVLFVGPMDLTMALGVFQQKSHPKYQDAIRNVAAAAHRAGKAAGVLMASADEFSMYHELGYRFIACGSDSGFVVAGAQGTLAAMKKQIKTT